MTILPLSTTEKAATGATHLVIWGHADLTETTANTAQLLQIPVVAGTLVKVIGNKLVTPFEDASDAAFNSTAITIGDGGSANRLLTSTELNVNGTEIDFKPGALAEGYFFNVADTIDITVNSMTAKSLSNIDAGEDHVYLSIVDFSQNPVIA